MVIDHDSRTPRPEHLQNKLDRPTGGTPLEPRLWSAQVGPKVRHFLNTRMPGYQRNSFRPLRAELRDLLAARWAPFASALGYDWHDEGAAPTGRTS